MQRRCSNGLGHGNFFPPGFAIDPDVTVTADNATPVVASDSAAFGSVVPTPGLTMTAAAKVSTDTELPVTIDAVSELLAPTSQGTFKSLYNSLCSDSASITVQLPANAVYVAGSGGTYNAGTHTVTLVGGPRLWRGLEDALFRVTFPASTTRPSERVVRRLRLSWRAAPSPT